MIEMMASTMMLVLQWYLRDLKWHNLTGFTALYHTSYTYVDERMSDIVCIFTSKFRKERVEAGFVCCGRPTSVQYRSDIDGPELMCKDQYAIISMQSLRTRAEGYCLYHSLALFGSHLWAPVLQSGGNWKMRYVSLPLAPEGHEVVKDKQPVGSIVAARERLIDPDMPCVVYVTSA